MVLNLLNQELSRDLGFHAFGVLTGCSSGSAPHYRIPPSLATNGTSYSPKSEIPLCNPQPRIRFFQALWILVLLRHLML